MLLGAILLGLVAIAFARAGEIAQTAFLRVSDLYPWAPLLLTPAVFALVAGTTRRYVPAAAGSGIPQVMAASHDPQGATAELLLSLRMIGAKFAGTLAMLLVGGSVGREGPTVQISAGLMTAVHRWLRVPISAGVIIAGGAAGVSAAFNTPLAGVTFAIEELASRFEQKLAALVMIAVVAAGLVSKAIAGDYIYFGIVGQGLGVSQGLGLAVVAGIAGGALGGLFARILVAGSGAGAPLLRRLRARPAVFAALCGLVVAALGVGTHGLSWGTGYETTRELLQGHPGSLWFGPAKFVATVATALCGAPGGIFAPSLSVGAGLGQFLALFAPDAPPGAVLMLGMVAYFTGVVRAPLTSVVILMEMTESRAMILPLFVGALVADQVSALIAREKLYHALSRNFRSETS